MSLPAVPKDTVSSKVLLGIGLVLTSAVCLAAQNIISKLFFVAGYLAGYGSLGGWIAPQFSNIIMLLALRMALMAGLLAIVAPRLYANTFTDIQQLARDFRRLRFVVGSGFCLFVGLTSLYFSLSQIAAGIAIATFFIYPAITLLLAWRFLKQPPRRYQIGLIPLVFCGIVLTTSSTATSLTATGDPFFGILGGLVAGLSFGVYGIFAELVLQPKESQRSLHPVPFSLVTFITVSALSSISLFFMPSISVAADSWPPILAMTVFSALITVVAYVLNNFGIRLIGASLTALISASTPALTALFAWFALQEALQSQQILGVAFVTVGVAALSFKAQGLKAQGLKAKQRR